jgi:hypothetical protein
MFFRPIHAVRDRTFILGEPKVTYCEIDLLELSKRERRDVLLAEDEDDQITCDACIRKLDGNSFVNWLIRLFFARRFRRDDDT